jgi:hypothetical protein
MLSENEVILLALCGFTTGVFWILSRPTFGIPQKLWETFKVIDLYGLLLPSVGTLIFPFLFVKILSSINESNNLNNQTAIISIFGTLLGATLTQAFNLISKRIDHKNSLEIKRLGVAVEVEMKHIIDPIISFLDKDIKLIQKGCAQLLSPEEVLTLEREHIFELSSIEARIETLGNEDLSQKFKKFSTIRLISPNESPEDRFEKLEQAKELEKEILSLLFERLRKLKA